MDTRKNFTPATIEGAANSAPDNQKRILPLLLATLVVGLVLAVAIGFTRANESQAARPADSGSALTYSNALEMMYARPYLEAQNKTSVQWGNALELQYARPYLEAQKKSVARSISLLELQYARPYLEAQNKASIQWGNALEMQYARPWLDRQKSPACPSRLDLFYACRNRLKLSR